MLFALAAALPAVALAAPAAISHPEWTASPNADQLSQYYPAAAAEFGVSGRSVIECTVTADGLLDACTVRSETPANWGFGPATVKTARFFRMSPQVVDGKPVGGAHVVVPIIWALADTVDNRGACARFAAVRSEPDTPRRRKALAAVYAANGVGPMRAQTMAKAEIGFLESWTGEHPEQVDALLDSCRPAAAPKP